MSKYGIFIGVDPGASGGIAVIGPSHSMITLSEMPVTERDVWTLIKSIAINKSGYARTAEVVAAIEKVGAMPGQGVTSMFTFGKGYGGLRMALTGAGIPFEEVQPRAWQKLLGIPARKPSESKSQFKNRLKGVAQRLFPRVEGITLQTCDALLIAEWLRRTRK